MARKNKKHFVLYNNGGVISATTPKDWARANKELFTQYNFSDSKNTPTVSVTEKELTKLGFNNLLNTEIVVFYQYSNL
jgi:hypothetical protein